MDTPIAFETQLTKSDLYWYLLYHLRRSILRRIILTIIFSVIVSLIYFFGLQLRGSDLYLAVGVVTPGFFILTALVESISYYVRSIAFPPKVVKKHICLPATVSFEADRMSASSPTSEGYQLYETIQDIFLYKRHVIIRLYPRLFRLIPWRDVPTERRDELKNLFMTIKRKLKDA